MSATTTGTKKESKTKSAPPSENSGAITPSSDSVPQSPPSKEANVVSRSYLRDAAEHLLIWMNRMQGQEVDPKNVNAVCNIAQQIANIVKTNIDLKKAGL